MGDLYRVISPAIVIRLADKGERYVYRDGVVDEATVQAGEIGRMIELGFVEKVAIAPVDLQPPANPTEIGGQVGEAGVDLVNLDLNELRALAAERKVDLQGATKKADIIAALSAPPAE